MLRSVVVGLASAAAAFVLAAFALTLLDLYLSGHGRVSPSQTSFLAQGQVQLSVADAAALAFSVTVGLVAFLRRWRRPRGG